MIKTLLKVRLRATLASLVGKRKDGKQTVSAGRVVLLTILYGYLALIFGAMFSFLAIGLGITAIGTQYEWIYFAVFMLISFSLIFIFSIFETKAILFECKDNELLLSMPISPRAIVISRVFTVLLYNYAEQAFVMVPCIAVYAVLGGSALGIIGSILIALTLPLFATALASGVGYLVALIAKRMKKNTIATTLVSLLFLGVYFYFCFGLGFSSGEELPDASVIAGSLYPLEFVGSAAMLHPLWTPLFVVLFAGVAYLVYRIIAANYVAIVTDNKGAKRTKYVAKRLVKTSAFVSLSKKELLRYFTSSTYILNSSLGLVFMLGIAVVMLFQGDTLSSLVAVIGADLPMLDIKGGLCTLLIAAITFMSSMTYISAPALSLEGKSLWIIKSMPLSARTVLLSKTVPHMVITTPPTLIASILLAIALKAAPVYWIFFILTPLVVNLACALFGMVMNTACPKFEYENEAQPIKSSLSVTVVMFGMMLYSLILTGASLLFSILVHPIFGAVMALVLSAVFAAALYLILCGPCARKYDSLSA